MDIKKDTTNPVLVSVFSNRIVVPVFYGVITSILLPVTVWYTLTSNDIFDIIGGIVAFILIAMIWLAMILGELRLRAIKISFTDNDIVVQSFFGIGDTKIYSYDAITSFHTTLQPALPLPYEGITLINNQKKVVHISQYYFANYSQLKGFVMEKFNNDGAKRFSLKKMFREIFS
jgi:hypothetical protein